MTFDKDSYWARRRNKNEYTLKSGRKVLLDKPLRGQGDTIKPRGRLVESFENRASRRAEALEEKRCLRKGRPYLAVAKSIKL